MDDIFVLSQRIIDEVTPQEKIEKNALAFQRVNESIQKLNDILQTTHDHGVNKHKLVMMKQ